MTIDRYLCPSCNKVFDSSEVIYIPPVSFDTEHKYDGYYEIWCPLCGKYSHVWEDDWKEWLSKYRIRSVE